jgi:hypothetical protein
MLTLPKGMRIVRSRATSSALKVKGGRKVTVSASKKGATTLSARLAVKLAARARSKVRRGRKLRLRYKVVAVETGGTRFKLTAQSTTKPR